LAPRLTVGGFFIPESPRFDPWLKSVLRWEKIGEKESRRKAVIKMFQCCSQALVQLCRTFDFDSLQVMEKMIHKEGPEAAMNSGLRSGTERGCEDKSRRAEKTLRGHGTDWNRLEQIETDTPGDQGCLLARHDQTIILSESIC
jgi:hypothetical protein